MILEESFSNQTKKKQQSIGKMFYSNTSYGFE